MKTLKPLYAIVGVAAVAVVTAVLTSAGPVAAHCQIPCGIYDDGMRFTMLKEHITTIEKSMNEITELSADPSANANQLIRWVMNKEDHADAFAEIVTAYFLQQRVKPTEARSGEEWDQYTLKLRLCHEMLVTSMKAKQTTDLQNVEKLRTLVDEFMHAYFTPEELEHYQEHAH